MAKKNELEGICGWLKFYFVLNIIWFISCLIGVILFIFENDVLRVFIFLVGSIFFAFNINLIYKEKKNAKIINMMFWIIAIFVSLITSFNTGSATLASGNVGGFLAILSVNLFAPIAWFFYFKNSKRVKNTLTEKGWF